MSYNRVYNLGQFNNTMRRFDQKAVYKKMNLQLQTLESKRINDSEKNKNKENYLFFPDIPSYPILLKLLNTSCREIKNNKTRFKLIFEIINFVFKHCALLIRRADLMDYYDICVNSKGKRYFDYINYKALFNKYNLLSTDNNKKKIIISSDSQEEEERLLHYLLFNNLKRWVYFVDKINLIQYIQLNWLHILELYYNFRKQQLAKRGTCKRGRKKRTNKISYISFDVTMSRPSHHHPSPSFEGIVK